jgi:alkylated DNA repair dioxygenase AlkB
MPAEEQDLLSAVAVAPLELGEFKMRGVAAKRRVLHFGWSYGYDRVSVEQGPPLPDFLLPVRSRLAELAGVAFDDLAEALITRYTPGAGIGWHRDAPMFGLVAAVSLAGTCRIRFRRGTTGDWEYRDQELEGRSAYVISGEARSGWQHSIPPVKALRYSITFRTMRRQR